MDQETYEIGRQAFAGQIEIDDKGCPVHRPTGLRLPRLIGGGAYHRDLRIHDTPIGIISWDQEISQDEQRVNILVHCSRLRGAAELLSSKTEVQLSSDQLAILATEMLRAYLDCDFAMIWHPNPKPQLTLSIAD